MLHHMCPIATQKCLVIEEVFSVPVLVVAS